MNYELLVLSAAKAAKVSGSLLLAICMHETGLANVKVQRDGNSPTYGICQVKYETAKMIGYTGDPDALMIPSVNAKYAALYLKWQVERYHGDLCKAVAAYNAGSYLVSTIYPGYPKNLKYVVRVQDRLSVQYREFLSCIGKIAEN